jgi:RNA polymerase sigma-70 factor (ECF subfamily)
MGPEELALADFDHERDITEPLGGRETSSAEAGLGFDALFDRYHSLVFHLAYRVLGDREEALDVCQEVFITVYRKLSRFRGDSSLKTWIYRIAVNRAANRCRWWNRLRRRGTISLEEHLGREGRGGLLESLETGETSPEESLLKREERDQLERSLAKLPVKQRVALVLRDIEGLPYEQISVLLEISPGTVKSRIARGREELKRRLNGALG